MSRGKILELLRPNESGKVQTVVATEVFGAIRSLAAFRMHGAPTDYIVVGSDSGRIVILQFSNDKNQLDRLMIPCCTAHSSNLCHVLLPPPDQQTVANLAHSPPSHTPGQHPRNPARWLQRLGCQNPCPGQ